MKPIKSLLLIIYLIFFIIVSGCTDRGMPAKYTYSFSIVDSSGINIVGDTSNRKIYYLDSIKFYTIDGTIIQNKFPTYIDGNGVDGYSYGVITLLNSNETYIIKYNNIIFYNDTISVRYGKHNVNIYRNNELIFNKEDISQTTEIHFNIIK